MRTRVIPAQITTVEDKIAGNLNLTQILLLMVPVFAATIIYGMFPPQMHLAVYKLPLFFFVSIISLILAIRIKGKVVLQWALLILRYNTRPKYYLFRKSDLYFRTLDLPVFEKKQRKMLKKATINEEVTFKLPSFAVKEMLRFREALIDSPYSYSIKSKKGGLYVALQQVKK